MVEIRAMKKRRKKRRVGDGTLGPLYNFDLGKRKRTRTKKRKRKGWKSEKTRKGIPSMIPRYGRVLNA